MQELYISTLSEYLSAIERLKTYYPGQGFIMNNPIAVTFLYRGLSKKCYNLLPGLFRTQDDECDKETKRTVRNSTYLSYGTERDILQAFIQEASSIVPLPSDDLSRWAEYAQHYGAPTRFLDWSTNPLVALYFACKDQKEKTGRVWLLHAKNYERIPIADKTLPNRTRREIIEQIIAGSEDYSYPLLYTPYYVDARMSAQSSYFMVWGAKTEPFEKMFSEEKYCMRLPEQDDGSRSYGTHEREALLFSFLVHADRKQPLLRELDTVGINEKTLFPGLDGIGRYVERTYRFDYNEAILYF